MTENSGNVTQDTVFETNDGMNITFKSSTEQESQEEGQEPSEKDETYDRSGRNR